ncbi:acyl-CoA carboxylase subunit beta [Frankia sp. AgB1.9]|uniref:acyl-CoA carboxylase subunit beta n=1 Tax=unclassified Frankia TaxID=2632575 RepID=UPI00193264ED|nr:MULTISPECIES: carboxyl transferase domain-containing protein [unclassified Frankia]MBL7492296.1 acyl-CoA carboxylase subunit beta [Frankia sp. AgW1.1]MBL7551115.1 acyl-CoA carboxylase subunit beta [Frankia sp. AgB1.9]MBL7621886.1 acyl-CoA carboxylase subunit beta [Frankia sp. AgB1.8]
MTLLTDKRTIPTHDPLARLSQLFDRDSFLPLGGGGRRGVVTGRGLVDGESVIAYCSDPAVMGGAMGIDGCADIVAAIALAHRELQPVVGLWHSGGARLAEGAAALHAVGAVFSAMTKASGAIPQISVVLGAAAGGAAYGPALTDLIIMAPAGRVFVTGPDVVREVTGESVDMEGLGGPEAHGRRSGVAHIVASSEQDAYARARRVLGIFTRPGSIDSTSVIEENDLARFLPESPRRAYDVRPLVRALVDAEPGGSSEIAGAGSDLSSFEEVQARWAPNVVTGFGRLAGRSIGVIANNPLRKGGCLDARAAEKSARFVRMCDALGVPLVILVDVPGYLPGVEQEWDGVVRRGAKLLHAFAEAVVPRVTLVTRKSFGGAYIAMNSRSLGATKVFAWPGAHVAVMGPAAAVGILRRRELAAAPDGERAALRTRLAAEHERETGGIERARETGVIDEIIEPATTRRRIAQALAEAPPARGRHGNIPL